MADDKVVDTEKVESGQESPNEPDRPAQDDVRVTAKTWLVVSILSFGYGLSFIVCHVQID
jgi:hypothetical protein